MESFEAYQPGTPTVVIAAVILGLVAFGLTLYLDKRVYKRHNLFSGLGVFVWVMSIVVGIMIQDGITRTETREYRIEQMQELGYSNVKVREDAFVASDENGTYTEGALKNHEGLTYVVKFEEGRG